MDGVDGVLAITFTSVFAWPSSFTSLSIIARQSSSCSPKVKKIEQIKNQINEKIPKRDNKKSQKKRTRIKKTLIINFYKYLASSQNTVYFPNHGMTVFTARWNHHSTLFYLLH